MKIHRDVLNAIREHGRDTYPEECCGFLIGRTDGRGNDVKSALRVENSLHRQRERRYFISPGDYLAAERSARALGQDIVGIYHSHPDHPAKPSKTDLEEATFPGFSYVIVSVESGAAGDLTAWNLAPDRLRFLEEQIDVVE